MPVLEPLTKQMHEAEREIDAIENKIGNADDSTTYPADYAAMRSEQEKRRQQVLNCKASINEQVMADQATNSKGRGMIDNDGPFMTRRGQLRRQVQDRMTRNRTKLTPLRGSEAGPRCESSHFLRSTMMKEARTPQVGDRVALPSHAGVFS
jgi:hypothetical protein